MKNENLWLAPIAGYTDASFRSLCKKWGAGRTHTEMVSAKALVYGDKKTRTLLDIKDDQRPCYAQIFGSDPDAMAEGTKILLDICRPDGIDINMGCPVPKVVRGGDGSALMRDPEKAAEITKRVKEAAGGLPVTVKFRRGWEEETAPEFAKVIEKAGADGICIHGRTRNQMYLGLSDRGCVARVKQAVSIPVSASGDAMSYKDCMDIMAETGVDSVMAARGALGNPFIFSDVQPDPALLADVMEEHLRNMCELKGELRGMTDGRKHALYYLRHIRSAAALKRFASVMTSINELKELCDIVRREGQLK